MQCMTIRKRCKDIVNAVESTGLKVSGIDRAKNGHLKVHITDGTKTLTYHTAATPSDWRGLLNLTAHVRRIFKENT